jgi:hypothetical protein
MLRSKDLRQNPIAVFNSILSARLICTLDFVFAETTLTRTVRMARRLPTHNRSMQQSSFSITNPGVVANARRHASRK